MANELLTPTIITKESVMAFRNVQVLSKLVNTEHTSEFRKIGDTITIRRPVLFEAVEGAALGTIQDAIEGSTTLVLNKRLHVPMSFPSQDLTLTIEDFSERYIKPAMEELAQKVESEIADLYKQIWNFTGTPGVTPATFLDIGANTALMDDLGVSQSPRVAIYSPVAALTLSDGLKSVFVQQPAILAIEEAKIGRYARLNVFQSASIASHTSGVATGTPLVNGAAQNVTYGATKATNSQSLITDGWTNSTTGILLEGDVFTIAGVNSVNRSSRVDTGRLAQFVVTADANSGATTGPATITISPPIITSGAFQTVTAAPADDAVITVISGTAGEVNRQNLVFHKNALTLAFAQLTSDLPGADSATASEEGISIRVTSQYAIGDDEVTWRYDVLFGVKAQNPGFAVRHTS